MTSFVPRAANDQLEELSDDASRTLLGGTAVGRIAFVLDGLPCVLPVNFRMLSEDNRLLLILRTRPGHMIDKAPSDVAFEIDGIDDVHRRGWSVLVQGSLHHLDASCVEQLGKGFDPKPWPQQERSSWLAIEVQTINGRLLHGVESEWAFSSEGYL